MGLIIEFNNLTIYAQLQIALFDPISIITGRTIRFDPISIIADLTIRSCNLI